MNDPNTFANYNPVHVLEAWEEVQARNGKVVDVGKPPRKRMSQWTFKETLCVLFALLVIGTVGPLVIVFGGLSLLAVWDHFIH